MLSHEMKMPTFCLRSTRIGIHQFNFQLSLLIANENCHIIFIVVYRMCIVMHPLNQNFRNVQIHFVWEK